MEDNSWIKLHRKFLTSPLWKYAVTSKMPHLISLWCYLLLSVNWEDKKWYDGKKENIIPAGSLITSIQHLSENTNTTPMQVRIAMQHYERMGMITRRTTNKWTQIWVVNWDKYQSNNTQDNIPITNQQQTDNKPITTTKEVKNIRIKDKEIYKEKKYGTVETITAEDIKEISDEYGITTQKVRFVLEQLRLYDKKVYKDYKLALRKWIVRDLGVDGLAKARAEKNKPITEIPEALISDEQREFNLKRLRQLKIDNGLIDATQ